MNIGSISIVKTADGSNTLFNAEVGEHYHSLHGAVQESRHVFINAGLACFLERKSGATSVSILEVGFGTGLNFLLTADYCIDKDIDLRYTGIEAYPLTAEMTGATGYDKYVGDHIWAKFSDKYNAAVNNEVLIDPNCRLQVAACKLTEFRSDGLFDIVYFDAFASAHQPEMWSEEAIGHAVSFLKTGVVFVTYAITGNLKRTLKSLGCTIEKIKGAPGKREMLRATRV
jgi:tRNA U34 5-methylaminomethyl-2-thiouridine-forming methyltransferase MnmC